MALPTGSTRITRRAVTYENASVYDSFSLAGRLTNTNTGDVANPGNVYRANNGQNKRQTTLLDTMLDNGDYMEVVLGYDNRAWSQITANPANGNDYTLPRPNTTYFSTQSTAITWTPPSVSLFKPGDRLTLLLVGTGSLELVMTSMGSLVYGGAKSSVKLKTGNIGASVVLEYGYLDSSTPTLGWQIVENNGVIGTYGDGNPIGLA